jgi:hypothetical protein
MESAIQRGKSVKQIIVMILLPCVVYVSPGMDAGHQPDSVVRKLYHEVVARHPLGIPEGADKAAIWPFLSKGLIGKLEKAQACEADYFRQHAGDTDKPGFVWLESGLFSGEDELALPDEAVVEHVKPQNDGSFQVYVRLGYRDAGAPNPEKYHWLVATRVIRESGHFVVDDVIWFKDDSRQISWRLSQTFVGCQGTHWVGNHTRDQ